MIPHHMLNLWPLNAWSHLHTPAEMWLAFFVDEIAIFLPFALTALNHLALKDRDSFKVPLIPHFPNPPKNMSSEFYSLLVDALFI